MEAAQRLALAVGGFRTCPFAACVPANPLHALLGALIKCQPGRLEQATTTELTKLLHTAHTFQLTKSTTDKTFMEQKLETKENRPCLGNERNQPAFPIPASTFDRRGEADFRNLTLPELAMTNKTSLNREDLGEPKTPRREETNVEQDTLTLTT